MNRNVDERKVALLYTIATSAAILMAIYSPILASIILAGSIVFASACYISIWRRDG